MDESNELYIGGAPGGFAFLFSNGNPKFAKGLFFMRVTEKIVRSTNFVILFRINKVADQILKRAEYLVC